MIRFVVAVFCLAPLPAADSFSDLAALYRYDRSAPLDVKLTEQANRSNYKLYAISYANPAKGRTPGFLVVPHKRGRKPGIVWMHSGGPLQWLGDAVLMADMGAVSILVDPPGVTPPEDPEAYRDHMIQSVVGLRRAVDVLAVRDDVDPGRIGFVGHSYGAMMGAVATSVDDRFRAAVYEVGLLGMSIHIATSPHPWAENVRKELGSSLGRFLEVISVVDAKNYIGKAPAIPKLFQAAYFDPGVPHKDAEDFFREASGPKEIKWYDTGHDVDDLAAISDRARFLAKSLGLKDVERVLRKKSGR